MYIHVYLPPRVYEHNSAKQSVCPLKKCLITVPTYYVLSSELQSIYFSMYSNIIPYVSLVVDHACFQSLHSLHLL